MWVCLEFSLSLHLLQCMSLTILSTKYIIFLFSPGRYYCMYEEYNVCMLLVHAAAAITNYVYVNKTYGIRVLEIIRSCNVLLEKYEVEE